MAGLLYSKDLLSGTNASLVKFLIGESPSTRGTTGEWDGPFPITVVVVIIGEDGVLYPCEDEKPRGGDGGLQLLAFIYWS